jgi:SAM-dependent methyltransferase
VFSRFGVMFFADPERAFSNLREALRPGGRASFVCWRPLVDNHWFAEPLRALVTVVTPPPPPPPGAPGPFSLGDPDRVRGILGAAGFDRIDIASHDRELRVGADLDEAVSFSLSMGPASRLLAEADAAQRARAQEVVRAALAPYAGGGGVVLTGAIWLVAARNPA